MINKENKIFRKRIFRKRIFFGNILICCCSQILLIINYKSYYFIFYVNNRKLRIKFITRKYYSWTSDWIYLEMLIKITNWIYLPLPFPISISEYFLST